MANNWTSVMDIMRDLSMVQGCGVPANIEHTVGAYDKPSTPVLSDEEDHPELCTVDFEYPAPDLGLIKEMLNMVRDQDVSSDEHSQCDMQISKKSDGKNSIKNNRKVSLKNMIGTEIQRTPNKRNVALTSILQIQSQSESPLKLMKPDDLVSTDMDESVEKVNGWLDAQSNKDSNKMSVVLEAGIMFKKKTPVKSPKEIDSTQTSQVQTTSGNYKPSKYADKLYNELKERQHLKNMAQEDIWAKAERQMKELDEKRKIAALKSPCSEVKSQSIDVVRLEQHRHLLTAQCIVCEIMKKHNFCIDIEKLDDDFCNTPQTS